MDSNNHAQPDALTILSRLTPAEIEARIAELRAEDAALRTLLRALRARDRRQPPVTPANGAKGVRQ